MKILVLPFILLELAAFVGCMTEVHLIVPGVVVSTLPLGTRDRKTIGGFSGLSADILPPQVSIRLADGKVYITEAIGQSSCIPGKSVQVYVWLGSITHKITTVSFADCSVEMH